MSGDSSYVAALMTHVKVRHAQNYARVGSEAVVL